MLPMTKPGSVDNHINGLAAYKAGDFKTAFEMWTKGAERGDAKAQFSLGGMYDRGEGVGQDYNQAVSWYRKAAEQGNADAQFNLGLVYGKGTGIQQDDAQSLFWFRRAADQGDSNAQFALGLMYESPKGVEQNYKQAIFWYKKAAIRGNSKAQINLGLLYLNGQGVTQDTVESLKWFMLAPACASDESSLNKAMGCLNVAMKACSAEQAAEMQKRSIDDPMFDPTPAYIISRVTEWRKQTGVFFDGLLIKHTARSKDTELNQRPEAYDETTKTEIAKSFRETFAFYELHSKYEESMGRLSRFLNENVLVENTNLPKISWWQKLKKLFEIENSYYQQAKDAFAAQDFENYEICSELAKSALDQIGNSIEKADTRTPVSSGGDRSEPTREIAVAHERATMKIFGKKSLPYLIYPGYLVALAVCAANAKDTSWARVGMYLLIAPFPIFGGGLLILAYGEWLFKLKALWQTDRNEFANYILIGLGKLFALLGVLTGLFGLVWAADPANQWVIWEAMKIIFYSVVVSIISFFVYVCYRRWWSVRLPA